MEPLGIILTCFYGLQVAGVPYFPVVQEVRAWDFRFVYLIAPKMQNRLKPMSYALVWDAVFIQALYFDLFSYGFEHINCRNLEMIRTPPRYLFLNFHGFK